MALIDNLTTKEKEELRALTNKDFTDPTIEMKLFITITGIQREVRYDDGEMLSGTSLTEMCDGNKEVAKLLILAMERNNGVSRNDLLYKFVFDNKDPREDELQRALLPEIVKEIRAKTGLSQRKFAEEYDMSVKSIEAWEAGSKKISKYAFTYLKNSYTEKIYMIEDAKRLELPLNILGEEAQEFLKKSTTIDHEEEYGYPFVRHMDSTTTEGEIFLLEVEDAEIVEDDQITRIWYRDNYPYELQKCMDTASKYGCTEIWFMEAYNYHMFNIEGDIEAKIDFMLSGRYKEIL